MSIVRELVQRADSWVNAMTGLGTLRDKLMHAQVVAGSKLQDPQLEALFNDDDVARRVVAKPPRGGPRSGGGFSTRMPGRAARRKAGRARPREEILTPTAGATPAGSSPP